ncbi:MAG TPA: hypothetical protein VG984_03470 [Candidatus Paceibacterota bacterium]|nr:hypothetical protein [Candidatus Paceibacterota bacterium]
MFAVWIPSQFAYVAGYLFNFGVQLGLNSASYALNFLSQGWAIVRDIANLAFIFILIYIAYTVIIGAETAGTMRALAAVIAMALLINFSFFLTRVVIDAGNLLAVQFYNAIPVSGPLVPSPIGGTVQPAVKDLTASIMDLTKVQTIMSDKSFQAFTQRSSGVGTFLTNLGVQTLVYISVGILITLLGFVFLLAGVKFLIRIVILWLAIIASPLAFAAHALPGNKTVNGYFRLWLTQLVQSAFYPAVFLFLFYIVTLFTTAMAGVNGLLPSVFQDSAITAAAAGGTGTAPLALATIIAGVAIRVGLVIVLVFYTMKFSDKFSSESSDAAQSVVSWASNRVAGAAGWTARNTAGRGANALARTTAMRNFAAESPLGRPVMASLKGIARSNLDVRGVSGLRSLAGTTGVTLDKPPAASFEKQVEARAQNIQDRAKEMKADSADYARADARYQNFKRNHAGGEEGFLREKRNLEVSKAMHEGLLASATNNKERLEAKADIDKIAKALRPYEDGRTRVKRLEEDRLNRFVQRIGEGNIYNVSNPSRGSIEGAARVRNTLKNENQTASVSAPTYKAAPMPHQNSTQPNPGKPGNTAGAHGSAPKTQAAKPAESHTDTDSTVELSEKTIKKLATALTNAVGHAQNKPITVVAANDNSRGTGPYSGGGALRAANDNDSHDTPAPAGGAMRASNDNSHDEGLKAA